MPGLDPGIHAKCRLRMLPPAFLLLQFSMDHWIKSGGDGFHDWRGIARALRRAARTVRHCERYNCGAKQSSLRCPPWIASSLRSSQ
jgi:hypothetical protein